jgi:hypothetical protein
MGRDQGELGGKGFSYVPGSPRDNDTPPRSSPAWTSLIAAALVMVAVAPGCQMTVPTGLRKVNDAKLENLPAVVTAPSEAKEAGTARAQINPRKNTATQPTPAR